MNRFLAAVERARSFLAADEGRLWGGRLDDVDWVGIESGRLHLTADPGTTGYERNAAGLWSGPLPDGIPVASTQVRWAGRRWAAVVLPLPDNDALWDPVRALVHEAMHVKQQESVVPGGGLATEFAAGSGTDLLETAEGRTWLRLEVAALSRALTAEGEHQRSAGADALLFRARRLALATAQEAARERNLDIAEGMPEYTAWRLTGEPADRLAVHIGRLPDTSWVRSFPYFTGPAYGYLLDALAPGWRPMLRERPDLPALLAPAVAGREQGDAKARGTLYALDAVREEELRREAAGRERAALMRERFSGTVLRIRTGGMAISFDPLQVTPIARGTVYRSLRWRSDDGSELTADEGLVTDNFSEIWVPLDPAAAAGPPPLPAGDPISGDGWTLRLGAAWELTTTDRGWLVRAAG